MSKTKQQSIGQLGEDIASRYLRSRKYEVIDRNYRRKWGEIDLICKLDNTIHFVEVKTMSVKKQGGQPMPEEHITPDKIKRLERAIHSYLQEKKLRDTSWQLDSVSVVLDIEQKTARCRLLSSIH